MSQRRRFGKVSVEASLQLITENKEKSVIHEEKGEEMQK
jgi:hypothetical protein